MPRSRAQRLLRAVAGASIATFVALLSHVAAGGAMPQLLGVLVPWVLSLAVCTMLAGRALSALRLSLAVVVSQLLFHLLFVLGAGSGDAAASAIPAGHVHGAAALAVTSTAAEATVDLGMWTAHAVAAAVTIVALYRGERAVLSLARIAREIVAWVRRRARALEIPLLALPRLRFACTPVADGRVRLVAASLRRRGPPPSFVV